MGNISRPVNGKNVLGGVAYKNKRDIQYIGREASVK